MKKNLVRSFLIFQFIFVLTACSSLDGLRFWNTDEVDPDEPRELEAFSNKKIISFIQFKVKTANKTGRASLIFCHQVLQQASVSL